MVEDLPTGGWYLSEDAAELNQRNMAVGGVRNPRYRSDDYNPSGVSFSLIILYIIKYIIYTYLLPGLVDSTAQCSVAVRHFVLAARKRASARTKHGWPPLKLSMGKIIMYVNVLLSVRIMGNCVYVCYVLRAFVLLRVNPV